MSTLRPDSTQPPRGFTLLELVVALLIVGIIAAAVFSTLRTAFRAKSSSESAVEPLQRAGVALDFVTRDLQSALPTTGVLSNAFTGTALQDDRGHEADDVVFFAATDAPPADTLDTDIRKIEYTVAVDGKDHQLVRYVTSNLLAPVTPDPTPEILCRGVRAFSIQYFDGTAWDDSWDSTEATATVPANNLPMVLEVTLDLEPPDSGGVPLHVVRLIPVPCSTLTTTTSTNGLMGGGL
jgi:general secretion pathway protein J